MADIEPKKKKKTEKRCISCSYAQYKVLANHLTFGGQGLLSSHQSYDQ